MSACWQITPPKGRPSDRACLSDLQAAGCQTLGIGDDPFFNSRSEHLAAFSATKRIYLLTTK
jgi:hypothetical protein